MHAATERAKAEMEHAKAQYEAEVERARAKFKGEMSRVLPRAPAGIRAPNLVRDLAAEFDADKTEFEIELRRAGEARLLEGRNRERQRRKRGPGKRRPD